MKRPLSYFLWLSCLVFSLSWQLLSVSEARADAPIVVIRIDGTINPATDDYLRSSLAKAEDMNAKLFILELNTPGGLLNSTQKMVESLLRARIPVVVYVSPSGGGAMSAGVFITMAGHIAVMAPGTSIGAAHPVSGSGDDLSSDMREKVENFAVSHITAIAEQRGRNVKWAEEAVRESVAITDREALRENVIDLIAGDLSKLLGDIEGRTITVAGQPQTLEGLSDARIERIEMSLRQEVVNILSDPNLAILLGLAAVLGIALELYSPGLVLPGVAGVVCLILSLVASQVIPINYGGVALLLLAFIFFIIEVMTPSFGILGGAGVLCLVLGSIYFVDEELAWGGDGLKVDMSMIGVIAATVGCILLAVGYLSVKAHKRQVTTGKQGMAGKQAIVKVEFSEEAGETIGRVASEGALWKARFEGSPDADPPKVGERLRVVAVEGATTLVVERNQ